MTEFRCGFVIIILIDDKGYAEPIAYEGALKIKEMSYMHAEGYSGGALKHGPFALIDDDNGRFGATPIIMFILDDQHAHHMRTAAEEVGNYFSYFFCRAGTCNSVTVQFSSHFFAYQSVSFSIFNR